MNYKITGAINKVRKYLIIYLILWVFIVLTIIMPLGAGIAEATVNGKFVFGDCVEKTINYFLKPLSTFGKVFTPAYIGAFFGILWKFTFVYVIIALIGIIRNAPKTEYEDIEHGSSDWAANGEQYKILSNKKGIILGENNYLPVDKRGNVNVLVVGRFWFW